MERDFFLTHAIPSKTMLLKRPLLFLLLFCLVCPKAPAQETKAGYAVYNTALGSVVGGIGAVINKKKDEKFGRVLVKGLWQGAMGGVVVHTSKLLVGEIGRQDSYTFSWYGKVANSVGNSIIENASLNRNFYEQFNMNIGFNRVEFHLNDGFKVNYKVMPVSFINTIGIAFKAKFEWQKSLQTGEMVFSGSMSDFTDRNYDGVTFGNVVVMDSKYVNDKYLYAHEFIHVYQYYDFNFVNTFLEKPVYKLTDRWFGKANKFIYYDLQRPVFALFYSLEYEEDYNKYYDNFFEREAAVYSNTY
jgi:hypothetical protein